MTGDSRDVVVVGGGIAGSALAAVLARNGFDVLVLERQTVFRDKIRGEGMAPWGVVEVLRLGLEEPLLEAGGGYATRVVPYGEIFEPAEAEAAAVPLDQLLPGISGVLDVGHPAACEALMQTAAIAGATVVRGVGDIEIEAADAPTVRYEHDGVVRDVPCRLIIGADGRMSTVRRQLGLQLVESTPRVFMGGMLVEDLDPWPPDQVSAGTEGDLFYFVMPRPNGVARLYLVHDLAQKGRFTSPTRQADFLAAFKLRCLPESEMFAAARPAGPCAFYAVTDSWTQQPCVPGAVLVGDAAGWNNPIIGQGLSIAMRDVRMVADVLCSTRAWSVSSFIDYAREREERMRRLRIAAEVATDLAATFGLRGAARRRAAAIAMKDDMVLAGPQLAVHMGPDQMPAESFEQPNIDRIRALG